jgi:hypothetical protein
VVTEEATELEAGIADAATPQVIGTVREHEPIELPLNDLLDEAGRLTVSTDAEGEDYFAVYLKGGRVRLHARLRGADPDYRSRAPTKRRANSDWRSSGRRCQARRQSSGRGESIGRPERYGVTVERTRSS